MNSHMKSVKIWLLIAIGSVYAVLGAQPSLAAEKSGEELYKQLAMVANGKGNLETFYLLNLTARGLNWNNAAEMEFDCYARHLKNEKIEGPFEKQNLYLLRKVPNDIFIIQLPEDLALIKKNAASFYAGLDKMIEDKMHFKIKTISATINGETYSFAQFVEKPKIIVVAKIFKTSITLMLFFVMFGMGLTLTLKDFSLVFTKPRGIIVGAILQWMLMPFLAMVMGRLLGFYEHYPYIFVGMILIAASPGGVTSNLMTHLAKGDLALSISLTSFSTILSLILTPLLLALYCSNVPEVTIPTKLIIGTILVLVLIPLILGMLVRGKWEHFAEKSTKFFSVLGIISLLFIIFAGLLMCGEFFSDTQRYGLSFYLMLFAMTMAGMIAGIIVSKLCGINNYQTRAISLETGLRNSALAMTIAILIQDAMGDFYSSMLFTTGLFGLWMFAAGAISIGLYKVLLPVEKDTL